MGVKIQTIKDIRFYLAKELIGIYSPSEIRVLANLLTKTVTGRTKLHQLYDDGYPVSKSEVTQIIKFSNQLKTGKPVQYILGETIFYDCKIKLNSSTLIPRPETEELVDLIIRENKDYDGNIIDFGTGSGCIAIALAVNLPLADLTGIDISEDALRIARENADMNNVKVLFIKGDILDFNKDSVGKAGIIVSNPPYVRNSEKALMGKNVLDFEPHQALFVENSDPLVFYNAILEHAENILLPGGRLYFEMNEAMGRSLVNLMESYGFSEIEIVSDINAKERIIKGRKNV
jgi:protein-(glutamine-N5) methyltransferase, release factor-specific